MTFSEMIRRLREELVPRGSDPIVLLRPVGVLSAYVLDAKEIEKAIDHLAAMPALAAMGSMTPLEKLGAFVLARSVFTAQELMKAPPLNRMPDDCP